MKKKKSIYSLIKDASFLSWMNKSNQKDVSEWEVWQQANPEGQDLLEDAKTMMKGLKFKKPQITEKQIDASWQNFASKLGEQPIKKPKLVSMRRRVLKIAAVLLVLITAIWGLEKYNPSPELIIYETAQGETKTISLPDESTVVLNTNSKLSLQSNWLNSTERKLSLEGEAYFEVKKQPQGTLFQVQSNKLMVEVMGTAFNFNGKRVEPIISLREGKVKMIKPGIGERLLKAGETAWFNTEKNEFKIQANQTEYWHSWIMQKWTFGNGTPMSEILERIEETFGMEAQVLDSKILNKRASGEVSVESLDVLLESLSILLELEIEVKKDGLVITLVKEEAKF